MLSISLPKVLTVIATANNFCGCSSKRKLTSRIKPATRNKTPQRYWLLDKVLQTSVGFSWRQMPINRQPIVSGKACFKWRPVVLQHAQGSYAHTAPPRRIQHNPGARAQPRAVRRVNFGKRGSQPSNKEAQPAAAGGERGLFFAAAYCSLMQAISDAKRQSNSKNNINSISKN